MSRQTYAVRRIVAGFAAVVALLLAGFGVVKAVGALGGSAGDGSITSPTVAQQLDPAPTSTAGATTVATLAPTSAAPSSAPATVAPPPSGAAPARPPALHARPDLP